jgi:dipeptidyl aminopeptidase/acylaminoacyl peptidase
MGLHFILWLVFASTLVSCTLSPGASPVLTATPVPTLSGRGIVEVEPPGEPFYNINLWSPDSRALVITYSRTYMGKFSEPSLYQIQLLDVHDRSLTLLEESSQNTLWPHAWLPGNKLAYHTDAAPPGIWSLEIETKTKTFLLNSNQAIWSSDGEKVAYPLPAESAGDKLALVVHSDPEGAEATYPLDGQNLVLQQWSPDAKQILFFLRPRFAPAPGISIFELPSGTSHLIGEAGYYSGANWSPDGKYIVYAYHNELGDQFQPELFLTNAQGTCSSNLIDGHGLGISQPLWSPDGKWIAFGWNGGIYLLDVEEFWSTDPGEGLSC